MRVVVLKDYAKAHFPSTPLLDYALEVEKITTSKVCCSYVATCPTETSLSSALHTLNTEPPNKGHFGASHVVLCNEVVLFSEVLGKVL